ncbi:TetR family transcriptional regulator [Streptomyces sp. NPDC059247]|uniref:TetR family transcriptional regulator n=1 Tax=Streptomyces sp. NPDC059247 TaxID=3346790 RepID=UPI00368ECB53
MSAATRTTTGTRGIARAAVQAELAHVAFDLFRRQGFDKVTVDDLAAAAGVSRSTFLRYFRSKEEAVLGAFDAQGEKLAAALRARPAAENDWTALRRALDTALEPYRQDPEHSLALLSLVASTSALCARRLEKQDSWRTLLAQALADRTGDTRPATLAESVRAAAALDCLNIALEHWSTDGATTDLDALVDQAFTVLTAPADTTRQPHDERPRPA